MLAEFEEIQASCRLPQEAIQLDRNPPTLRHECKASVLQQAFYPSAAW